MPRIREYSSQVSADGQIAGRQATGSDFGGEGISQLGAAAGAATVQLHEKAAQDDVTNVRVELAKARAEWDVHFRDRSAKTAPGDPTFADRFEQDFSDYLGNARQIAQTREGQRTFDLVAAELSGHFKEKAGLFQVASAGIKARQDWEVSSRAYATSVVTDPTSYMSVRDQALAELDDPNGRYSRLDMKGKEDLKIKMRDTLARSYVNGLIDNGAPELARKQLMDGKLDDQLDPVHKQALVRAADVGINAKQAAAEHAESQRRRDEKIMNDAKNDELMGRFVQGKLTVADVRAAGLPVFGEGSQNQWIGMLRTQAKEWQEKPIKTSPSVMVDAFERINLPAGDPRKITSMSEINKLYTDQSVSWADLSHLQKAFKDQQDEAGVRLGEVRGDFLKGIKPQLDKSTMNRIDQGGAERTFKFTMFVNEQVAKARAANQDPYELFNPGSPKYLGKYVPQFQSGAQTLEANLAGRINESLNKANAGKPRPSLKEIFGK